MKTAKQVLPILLAVILLFTTLAVLPTSAEAAYTPGDTNGKKVNPDGVIYSSASRMVWAQNNAQILTGRQSTLIVAQSQMTGLAVDPGQRYAFGGFVGGREDQRAVEMIDMWYSNSVGFWQYRNDQGEYANPRALEVKESGTLFVGMDGTSDGVQVAVVQYDTATGEMKQHSVTQVLAQPDSGELLCRAVHYGVIDGQAYLYVLTSDNFDGEGYTAGVTNYDRLYRFTVGEDLSLTPDMSFGIDENSKKGVGFCVVAVAGGRRSDWGNPKAIAEVYDVEVRSDGVIFVSCGAISMNAVALTPDGTTLQADETGSTTAASMWAGTDAAYYGLGPIALIEDTYLTVAINGSETNWGKNHFSVYNAQTFAFQTSKTCYWEMLSYNTAYEKNKYGAMCYVGGNLYMVDTGTGTPSNDFHSAASDKIIVMNFTEDGRKPANRIFSNQAGRPEELDVIWAQSGSEILTAPGETLRQASGNLEGFAVSPDEKYAFLGFTGGEAENRALEMISLETGASLGMLQYQDSEGNYAFPRAVDVDDQNNLYIGLDGTSEGVQIGFATYNDAGEMELNHRYTISDNTGLLVRDVRYRVIDGVAYLYVLVTDGKADTDTANDLIYRFVLLPENEDRMAPDILFGEGGSGAANPRALSKRTDGNILELYAMDVDTDGAVYVSCNGSLSAVRLTNNGTTYTAMWESNGYDEAKGAIVILDRFIVAAINGGDWPNEGMAWMKDTGYWSFTRQSGRIGYDADRMNCYVHMRYVNGTLYVADRGAGGETDAIDPSADKIWAVRYSDRAYIDTVETVGYQLTEVDDAAGTYRIRFAAVLDSIGYTGAGFEISYRYTDTDGGLVEYSYPIQDTVCSTAYTSLSGINGPIRAEGFGGQYLIAMAVNDIPAAVGEIEFTVRSYVVDAAGNRLWEAETHTVTIQPLSA